MAEVRFKYFCLDYVSKNGVSVTEHNMHVQNLAPMSVVFNPTWRSRKLVELGGELVMMKCQGMQQFSQVGRGGYAFGVGGGVGGGCAVGGGGMASND